MHFFHALAKFFGVKLIHNSVCNLFQLLIELYLYSALMNKTDERESLTEFGFVPGFIL